jgi:hypothetical protein
MAQTNYTPISLYYSTTASAVPTAANLVQGELAINTADGKLYYEDSSGVVQVLATKSTGSIGGSNTQVQFNNSGSLGGSSGLTWDGSFLTTSSIKNSALTSGRVTYAGASGLLSDSAGLTFDGTNLTTTGTATATRFIPSGSTVATNGMYLPAANTLGFSTNSTERMRITSGGTITLSATSNGSADIQVINNTNGLRLVGGTTIGTDAEILIGGSASGTGSNIYFDGADKIFRTAAGSEQVRIDSSGNLLVGTTSAVGKLTIDAPNTLVSPTISMRNAGGLYGFDFDSENVSVGRLDLYAVTNGARSQVISFMRSSGNVGIGTSSPSTYKFEVYTDTVGENGAIIRNVNTADNAATILRLYAGTNTSAIVRFPSTHASKANELYITNVGTTSPITFATQDTERMRIDSAGDLLVGTTSNTTNGGFIFATNFYGAGRSVQVIGHINGASSGDAYMIFNYNGTGIGSITQSGTTAVLYNTTSDQRLKTNIVDAPSGNIDDIKVRSFDWIVDGSHQEYGMVAQELVTVAPYAVNKPENPDEMMAVDYSKLVPMMIKEIKGLKQRIATLENK